MSLNLPRFALAVALATAALAADQVKVASGTLEAAGALPNGVREFKGIPFADPPVGPQRWRPDTGQHSGQLVFGIVQHHQGQAQVALRAIHKVFQLDTLPPDAPSDVPAAAVRGNHRDPVLIIERLRNMEELTIEEITLDDTQARVTIAGLPDQPGVAAAAFEVLSAGEIFVDMIVQSESRDGLASLSFTVPQASLEKAVARAPR